MFQQKIKNRKEILSHGDIASRKVILDITEATLNRLDAYQRIKSIMKLEGNILKIGRRSWDLSKKGDIYLLGAGKACNAMAMAVEEILGEHLTAGYAIIKIKEDSDIFKKTKVFVGGHPLPNKEGFNASKEILDVIDNASKDDIFIVVISGGSSALMSYPIEGISLQDEIDTTDVLLKSGANIIEINAIRRHISQINGGRLAQRIEKVGAKLIGLAISDSIDTPATTDISIPYLNYQGTAIGPDQTTINDARRVIHNYNLTNRLPKNVVNYIMNCDSEAETPKAFSNNTYFLLNSLPDSISYAKEIIEDLGLPFMILTTFLEGESKEAGTILASIAREIQTYARPIAPPCIILCAGETTTKIANNSDIKGHGGPSQELAVSFAIRASKIPGACILSIDSEGTDGTSIVAGGITDSQTYKLACEKDVDLFDALRGHSCYEALDILGDTVFTGNTGTNLCDFNIVYIPSLD